MRTSFLSTPELLTFYLEESRYCHPQFLENLQYASLLNTLNDTPEKKSYQSACLRQELKLEAPTTWSLTSLESQLARMTRLQFYEIIHKIGAVLCHQELRKVLKKEQLLGLYQTFGKPIIHFALNRSSLLLPNKFKSPPNMLTSSLKEGITTTGIGCLFCAINKAPAFQSRLAIKLDPLYFEQWIILRDSFYLNQKSSSMIIHRILEQKV